MANRVLVVGWDGADWEVLDPLLAAGDLPNLAALAERGARGVARSVLPSHSWAAWPSFLTGLDPAGHGVFDILEHRPGQTRRLPVSSRSILAPTWPMRLSEAGRTVLLVNVPLTYPPLPVRGVCIAGGVIPPKAVFSHPAAIGPELGWPINGGSWTTFRHRPLDLVADVEQVTAARAEAVRRLMDTEPWDVACAVFVSPDRIQHCLLEYVHPGHPDHARAAATPMAERVRDVYRMLDRELGTLVERTDESDTVFVMSDHGHQPCTRALNMNRVLERMGYLRMGRGSALIGLLAWGRVRSMARVAYDSLGLHGKVAVPTAPIDWARTRAYTSVVSTGEGVSLALRGREPEGTVAPGGLRARPGRAGGRPVEASPTRRPAGTRSSGRCRASRCWRARTSTARPTCCWRPRRSTRSPTPGRWWRRPTGCRATTAPRASTSPRARARAGRRRGDLAHRLRRADRGRGRPRGRGRARGGAGRADGRGVLRRGAARGRGAPARAWLPRVAASRTRRAAAATARRRCSRAPARTSSASPPACWRRSASSSCSGGRCRTAGWRSSRSRSSSRSSPPPAPASAWTWRRCGRSRSARAAATCRGAAQPGRPLRRHRARGRASSSGRRRGRAPLAGDRAGAIAIGAAALPLIAAANVYLGATRGLKRMGPTLWVFWIGQPVAWIALAAVAIALGGRHRRGRRAYDLSWLGAAGGGAGPVAAAGGLAGRAPGHARRARGRPPLRRAAGALGAARPGALLGRPVRARPLRLGPAARRLRGRRPHRPADPALPDLGEPGLLAVRGRPARARRAGAARRALQARDALGARGDAAARDRPLRGRAAGARGVRPGVRGGRDAASDHAARPDGERRHRRRRLRARDGRVHRASTWPTTCWRRSCSSRSRSRSPRRSARPARRPRRLRRLRR